MSSPRSVVFALVTLLLVVAPGRADAQFFGPPAVQADAGNYLFSAGQAMGDVNGDGKSDVVALKFRSGEPAMWVVRINDGNGNFVETQELATGVNTTPTIADADSDGHADLLISFLGVVRVYWGVGDGTFPLVTEVVTASTTSAVASIAVGNWNGDGYPDLAFGQRSSPTGVTVRYGLGNRQFDAAVAIADVAFAVQVSTANIDGDSKSDLLVLVGGPVALGPPSVRVLTGASNLTYDGFGFTLGAVTSSTVLAMTVADLNGDELTEAVVTASGLYALTIAYPGGLPVSQALSGVVPAGVRPAVTDVDGDGRVDVVVAHSTSATVLRAQDDGSFSATPSFSIAELAPRWTLFGDANGDQALDIVTGGGAITTGVTEIAVTLHVPPLRIGINPATSSTTAGSNGIAPVSLVALVDSGHADVSFSWFTAAGSEPVGSGTNLTLAFPVGVHTLTLRGSTAAGLKAVANAVVTVTVPPPPASETTVQGIQTTLDSKLDVAVSSRASSAEVASIGVKVDLLKTLAAVERIARRHHRGSHRVGCVDVEQSSATRHRAGSRTWREDRGVLSPDITGRAARPRAHHRRRHRR